MTPKILIPPTLHIVVIQIIPMNGQWNKKDWLMMTIGLLNLLGVPDFIGNPRFPSQTTIKATIAWSFHQGDGLNRLENISLMFDEVGQLKDWYNSFNQEINPCSGITNIEESEINQKISLYPNPNSGTFYLDFPNLKLEDLRIFDADFVRLVYEFV